MTLPSLRDALYMLLELVCCLLLAFLWGLIQHHEGVKWEKAQAKAVVQVVEKQSPIITTRIVKEYIPVVQKVKGDTITIIKKVPVYVTHEEDVATPIPNGFVSLWNATNKMQLPGTSSSIDGGASNVVLSDIAAQHAREVGICTANEAQQSALKEWILQQQSLYNSR